MSTTRQLKARARSAATAGLAAWRGKTLVPAESIPVENAPEPQVQPFPDDPVLARARALGDARLLQRPVFILSSIRSGSTLLRVMLNTHSQIYAPHELHLGGVRVNLATKYAREAMRELGLGKEGVQFLLWDRLLQRELVRNNKSVLVNKTPSDAFMWRKILRCWPDARFIYLLRHPAAVTDSWQRARKEWPRDRVGEDVKRYMVAVQDARSQLDGLTVRYEDITRHPERELTRICEFVGVEFESSMVDYAGGQHGRFKAGLGDWSKTIKSGVIQPVERMPDEKSIPATLLDVSKQWGYIE